MLPSFQARRSMNNGLPSRRASHHTNPTAGPTGPARSRLPFSDASRQQFLMLTAWRAQSLHHCITTGLHHYRTTSIHHYITTGLHHHVTTSLQCAGACPLICYHTTHRSGHNKVACRRLVAQPSWSHDGVVDA